MRKRAAAAAPPSLPEPREMSSTCWSCGESVNGRFCSRCKALQPPPRDYFEFFEIPLSLAIDGAEFEKRFYALSRQLHPDLFSRRSPREREYSLESTAILNDGYRTLRDPISRAQYVLKKEGFEIGEQGTKDVPPELLEEVFDLNMALEELNSGDKDALGQIDAARERFQAMRDEVDADLKTQFHAWDNTHAGETLTAVRALVNRRKYITNLITQTESA